MLQKLKNLKERFNFKKPAPPHLRSWRLIISNKIYPNLRRGFFATLLLIFLGFIYFIFFKPEQIGYYYNKISEKIYRKIDWPNDFSYEINISGQNFTKYDDITNLVYAATAHIKNNNKIILQNLEQKITALPWVKNAKIRINLEKNINISIEEHQPFALWQQGKIKYVISRDGHLVRVDNWDNFSHLIILGGKDAHKNVANLFNILAINPEIGRHIYSASWIGQRRWDIRLNDGLLIKLPEENVSKSWQKLAKIYKLNDSRQILKVIDLRLGDKIYLEYDDKTAEEIFHFNKGNAKSIFE